MLNSSIITVHIRTFFFVLFISFLVYFPHPNSGFVLDDHYVVEQNPFIKNIRFIPEIFQTDFFHAYKAGWNFEFQYYRPLVTLSFLGDYHLWGLQAWGFRVTNIFIHALNAYLAFVLTQLLFGQIRLAFGVAIIFCLLPAQEWVVRYIVGRGDLLQAFFSLGAMCCFVHYWKSSRISALLLGGAGFVFSCLCREATVFLPLYLAVLVVVGPGPWRPKIFSLGFVGILAVGFFVFRESSWPILNYSVAHQLSLAGVGQWILNVFAYYDRFIVPWALGGENLIGGGVEIFFVAIMALVSILIFRETPSHRKIGLCALLWLAVGALNFWSSGELVQRIGPYLAEHLLYFPSVGCALLLSFLLERRFSSWLGKGIFLAWVVFAVGILSWSRQYWRDEKTLLSHVRDLQGHGSTTIDQQLLMRYEDDPQKVLVWVDRSHDPITKSLWLKRLGNLSRLKGDRAIATRYFQQALDFNPKNIEALNELAVTYLEDGQTQSGLGLLQKSLAMEPQYSETSRLLGIAEYLGGNYALAGKYLKTSLGLNPDNWETQKYLLMAYLLSGEEDSYQKMMDSLSFDEYSETEFIRFVSRELYRLKRFEQLKYLLGGAAKIVSMDQELQALQRKIFSVP